MRSLLALSAACTLSGCITAGPQVETTSPYPLSKIESAQIESAVRNSLKDPQSANFGHMVAGKEPNSGKVIVCGHVNAKNSFGGYVGMSPFTGELFGGGQFQVAGIGGNPDVSLAIAQVCAKRGLSI